MLDIFSYIRTTRSTYESETIEVVAGYRYSQRKTIEKITKYSASQYDGDNKDAILGELPFDSVSIEPVEKEIEATDFDNADIEVRPKTNTDAAKYKAMIATKALRDYADETGFATTLNDICTTRARYGGVLVKDTDDGTKVVPWANVITDQSDIMAGTIIERHYYTPAELKKMKGWKNVDEAITSATQRRAANLSGTRGNDTHGHLIEVYEVHGSLPEAMIKADGEPLNYIQYMYVVAGVDWQDTDKDTKHETENGIILFESEESELPYKYNARNPIVGRGLGVGVIESLFNQQKYHNFALSEEFRLMSIAGKVFFDSDNPDTPSNLLTALDQGTVLKRQQGQSPITMINAVPASLPNYANLRSELSMSSKAITGAYESVTGEEGKSNKPFKLAALQNIEGHSRYEQEREELGELIEAIITDWELPHALKWITSKDEIYTHFDQQELSQIDEVIRTTKMNEMMINSLRNGEPVTADMIVAYNDKVTNDLRKGGSKRLVTDLKEFLKDIDGRVSIATTSESNNSNAWFETRSNLIQILPPEDPRRNALIDSVMNQAGITPDELRLAEEKTAQQTMPGVPGAPPPASGTPLPQNAFTNISRQAPALQV